MSARERVLQRMREGELADLRSRQRMIELAEEDLEREYRPDGMPKRRRATKTKKADRPKRPPNQWQKNLTAWNANNSGWCIPKKGTADYNTVKNYHTRRGLEVSTPGTPSRRAVYLSPDAPTPQRLTYEERPRPATAEVSLDEIAKLRADLNAVRQRQAELTTTRRATFG